MMSLRAVSLSSSMQAVSQSVLCLSDCTDFFVIDYIVPVCVILVKFYTMMMMMMILNKRPDGALLCQRLNEEWWIVEVSRRVGLRTATRMEDFLKEI